VVAFFYCFCAEAAYVCVRTFAISDCPLSYFLCSPPYGSALENFRVFCTVTAPPSALGPASHGSATLILDPTLPLCFFFRFSGLLIAPTRGAGTFVPLVCLCAFDPPLPNPGDCRFCLIRVLACPLHSPPWFLQSSAFVSLEALTSNTPHAHSDSVNPTLWYCASLLNRPPLLTLFIALVPF